MISFHKTPIGLLIATWQESAQAKNNLALVSLSQAQTSTQAVIPPSSSASFQSQTKLFQNLLDRYFSGENITWSQFITLEFITGTDFQKAVWQEISQINFGQLTTYSELAAQVNRPQAVRAVGTAVGKNPLPIIIGCHRVLTKNHQLGGFAWGTDIKKHLLQLEGHSYL